MIESFCPCGVSCPACAVSKNFAFAGVITGKLLVGDNTNKGGKKESKGLFPKRRFAGEEHLKGEKGSDSTSEGLEATTERSEAITERSEATTERVGSNY